VVSIPHLQTDKQTKSCKTATNRLESRTESEDCEVPARDLANTSRIDIASWPRRGSRSGRHTRMQANWELSKENFQPLKRGRKEVCKEKVELCQKADAESQRK